MSESNREDTRNDASSPGVNRRSIIAGAAWSVPVVAAAIAVPVAAATEALGCADTLPVSRGFNDISSVVQQSYGKYQTRMHFGNNPSPGNINTLLAPVGIQTQGASRPYVITKVSWEMSHGAGVASGVMPTTISNPSAWKVVDHGWSTTGAFPGINRRYYSIENVNPSGVVMSVPWDTIPAPTSPNSPFPPVWVLFAGASNSQFWGMDAGATTIHYYFTDIPAGCEGSAARPLTYVLPGPTSW